MVVNYSGHREGADEVVRHIEDGGGNAFTFRADVSSEEDVQAMFRAAVDEYGTVDILVNNAGIQKDAAFLDMTLEQWNRVIGISLTVLFCAHGKLQRSSFAGEWFPSGPGPSEKSSLSARCMKSFLGRAM